MSQNPSSLPFSLFPLYIPYILNSILTTYNKINKKHTNAARARAMSPTKW
nr:MAG TPA: hypothetical protein [Caudoviricetes sp.]